MKCKYCGEKAEVKSYRSRSGQVSSEIVCLLCNNKTNQQLAMANLELILTEIELNGSKEESLYNVFVNKELDIFAEEIGTNNVIQYRFTENVEDIKRDHRVEILLSRLGKVEATDEVSLGDIFMYGKHTEVVLQDLQSVIDLKSKMLRFVFNDETFNINLGDGKGDLGDYWGTITLKDETQKDFNFSWEGYSEGSYPSLSIYGLLRGEDGDEGTLTIDTSSDTPVNIILVFGTEDDYFEEVKIDSFRVRFISYIDVEAINREEANKIVESMEIDMNDLNIESLI